MLPSPLWQSNQYSVSRRELHTFPIYGVVLLHYVVHHINLLKFETGELDYHLYPTLNPHV